MTEKLYNLTQSALSVWQKIEAEEGDLQTLQDTLESIEGAIEEKASNMVRFIQMLDTDTSAIETEIERLKLRKKARENRAERIREYLKEQMIAMGKDKISTPLITVTVQNNKPSVEVIDEFLLPRQFIERTIVDKVNKHWVLKAIQAGENVPGAVLKASKSLHIR